MIFPYRDENPPSRLPIVTLVIIAVNILVYLRFGFSASYEDIVKQYGFTPSDPSLLTLLTSIFLHGGLFHLFGNMWFLWLFGDNVEDKLGRSLYILFYLACGAVAGWAHAGLVGPEVRAIPCIGASGAISGVLGAYLILFPRARVRCIIGFYYFFRRINLSAMALLGLWFILQFIYGTISHFVGATGIAYWAHVGGFLFGLVIVKGVLLLFLGEEKPSIEPISSGAPGELPKPIKDVGPKRSLELIDEYLKERKDHLAIDEYMSLRRKFPYDMLSPDSQMAIANIFEENNQPHLALEAYTGFLKRYDRHPKAPLVRFKIGMLYSRRFGFKHKALIHLKASLGTSGQLLDEDTKEEIKKEMERIKSTLDITFLREGEEGKNFTVIQQTAGPILLNEVANIIARAKGVTIKSAMDELKANPGFLLRDVDRKTADWVATTLQFLARVPVLVLGQDEILESPPARYLKGGGLISGGLRAEVEDGELEEISWDNTLIFICGQIRWMAFKGREEPGIWEVGRLEVEGPTKRELEFNRFLDIFTIKPQSHFRISSQRFDYSKLSFKETISEGDLAQKFKLLVERLVKDAVNVRINEGVHALLFGESWERSTFDNIDGFDRYNHWQLQLANMDYLFGWSKLAI